MRTVSVCVGGTHTHTQRGLSHGNTRPDNNITLIETAMTCHPLRLEQLETLVDCLLLNFKRRVTDGAGVGPDLRAGRGNRDEDEEDPAGGGGRALLCCPGCRQPLSDPITLPCGHTWCRRCLQLHYPAACRLCGEPVPSAGSQPLRANVILSCVMDKWLPAEGRRSRAKARADQLVSERGYQEALELLQREVELEPADITLLGYRAESYAGLQRFKQAFEDVGVVCSKMPNWPEGHFRKGKVLNAIGQADEALQSFLQCLALDEDFTAAKIEIQKILQDMLSPVENVKEGQQESLWMSPQCLRSKMFPVNLSTSVACSQTSSSTEMKNNEKLCHESAVLDVPKPMEESESTGSIWLRRAQSVQILHRVERLVGPACLKRISSAPLLSSQDKGTLLKRKLSSAEHEHFGTEDGSKHKKTDAKQHLHISTSDGSIPENLIDATDFECSLCMRLFYEPVTLPCGHTFCKSCLERCLDHSPQCPLCKESLKEYLANRKYIITHILEEVISRYLSEELHERKKVHIEETAELSNLTKNVPIFVCTMAYPTVPCPLHVFEPRYRLMIRRCIETGTKQFGMCISDSQNGFTDYGCMLQIRNVHFLPDGRSVVDTIGGNRFKVLERGLKDGYSIANTEYLEDVKVDGQEFVKLVDLHNQVYSQAYNWFQNLRNRFRSQILQHFGPMPEREADVQATPNGPAWCWWLLAVLPVDPRYQLSVLSMTSLKKRLIKIQHILTYFSRDHSK